MSRAAKVLIRFIVIVLILTLIALATYFFWNEYLIDPAQIYVEGNRHYSDEDIIEMVMNGPLDDNSLILSMKYRNKKLTDVPFVDAISVDVVSKNSVKILVIEKALAGYVNYLEHCVYFDKDGYVVESSNVRTQGVPQVTGITFSGMEIGKPLADTDSAIFTRTLDVTKLIDKYSLTIDRIHFYDNGDLSLYFGDVRVDLGDESDHMEDKVMVLPQILPSLTTEKGILHMENYSEKGEYRFVRE